MNWSYILDLYVVALRVLLYGYFLPIFLINCLFFPAPNVERKSSWTSSCHPPQSSTSFAHPQSKLHNSLWHSHNHLSLCILIVPMKFGWVNNTQHIIGSIFLIWRLLYYAYYLLLVTFVDVRFLQLFVPQFRCVALFP